MLFASPSICASPTRFIPGALSLSLCLTVYISLLSLFTRCRSFSGFFQAQKEGKTRGAHTHIYIYIKRKKKRTTPRQTRLPPREQTRPAARVDERTAAGSSGAGETAARDIFFHFLRARRAAHFAETLSNVRERRPRLPAAHCVRVEIKPAGTRVTFSRDNELAKSRESRADPFKRRRARRALDDATPQVNSGDALVKVMRALLPFESVAGALLDVTLAGECQCLALFFLFPV